MTEHGGDTAISSAGVVPAAPPTTPGPLPPQPNPWPTAVGVVAIVFGAAGLLGGAAGIAGTLMTQAFAGFGAGSAAALQAIRDYRPWLVLQNIAGALLAGLLLAGGIGLTSRRKWSVPCVRTWTIAKFLLVPASAAIQYLAQRAQMEAMLNEQAAASGMPPGAAMGAGFMGGFAIAGIGISVAWGWALPLFMLVWFSRPAIKAETSRWK